MASAPQRRLRSIAAAVAPSPRLRPQPRQPPPPTTTPPPSPAPATSSGITASALDGINVVDIGSRASTAWCSRQLADWGASVASCEPPGGHILRQHPPFDGSGQSTTARYFLANKASVPRSREADLLRAAHVIVTSAPDAAEMARLYPQALVCAITPHGLDGDSALIEGNELTAGARSGWANCNGLYDRAPLKPSGYQASYQAGTFAYGCVICALIELSSSPTRGGQLIDVSELEVMTSTAAPALLRTQMTTNPSSTTALAVAGTRRMPPIDVSQGPVPCKDGYFAAPMARAKWWIACMELLGLPDLARDPELLRSATRPKHQERFADRVQEKLMGWTRLELFDALSDRDSIAGPVITVAELGSNAQLIGRDFFVDAPRSGSLRFPGPPAKCSGAAWQLHRGMGAPFADADFALNEAPLPPVEPQRCSISLGLSPAVPGMGPLSGFRGVVLTQAWAGTYATQLLGLMGADVIQLEVRNRVDSWRGGNYTNPMPAVFRDVPTAQHPWNCNPLYNSVNLNKRCITVDLAQPEGIDLFEQLVAQADFVAENFSPRVMPKLGLGFDRLSAINPRIVMASLSAYGASGPWSDNPGIGGTIEPTSGMSSLLGYENEGPQSSGQMYPDPVAGLHGFGLIATALYQRERTGRGQYIDLSMQESSLQFIGDAFVQHEATGVCRQPAGNSHPLHAPHSIYRTAGDEQSDWVAIAAENDEQWLKLCDALSIDPAPAHATAAGRKADEAAVDGLIGAAVRQMDKVAVEEMLCAAGLPAAAVRADSEVYQDPVLRQRGHVVLVDHPETGPLWQSGLPAKLSRTPGGVTRPAPLQSEHSAEVFSSLLGMTAERYDELVAIGVTGAGPFPPGTRPSAV